MDLTEDLHRHYVGGSEEALSNPLVSPLLGDFGGMPPLLFHASGSEILLDDSVLAVGRARAADVECELEVFPGMPHAWHAVSQLPESKRAVARIGEFTGRCITAGRQPEERICTTPT
jgi:acetyl esterase/lipase